MILTRPCGVMPSLSVGESLHVAKHHGHDAALAFSGGQAALIDQARDDPRIDVAAERLLNLLLLPQLFDHAVERRR